MGVGGDAGATVEAGVNAPTATILTAALTQSCMPEVEPDPLRAEIELELANPTTATIGPATVDVVEVRDANDALLATFAVGKKTLGPVDPGKAGYAKLSKLPETLSPAKACATLPCGANVRLVAVLTGPNLPTLRAQSAATSVECFF
jgi:hypothetical protein